MAKIKVLIAYYSRQGSTEKMAAAVAEGAKEVADTDVVVKKVDATTLDDLLEADTIIVGSPTYYGLMASKIKHMFDESVEIHGKLEGKVGAAFTSSGGTATGAETTLLSILQAMLVHGMIVQGRAEDKHYGAACIGTPDAKGFGLCRELGKRTATLAAKIKKQTV